jgi:hypothetical protein
MAAAATPPPHSPSSESRLLSGVLRTVRAVDVNIGVLPAFVEPHRAAASYSKSSSERQGPNSASARTTSRPGGAAVSRASRQLSPEGGRIAATWECASGRARGKRSRAATSGWAGNVLYRDASGPATHQLAVAMREEHSSEATSDRRMCLDAAVGREGRTLAPKPGKELRVWRGQNGCRWTPGIREESPPLLPQCGRAGYKWRCAAR